MCPAPLLPLLGRITSSEVPRSLWEPSLHSLLAFSECGARLAWIFVPPPHRPTTCSSTGPSLLRALGDQVGRTQCTKKKMRSKSEALEQRERT